MGEAAALCVLSNEPDAIHAELADDGTVHFWSESQGRHLHDAWISPAAAGALLDEIAGSLSALGAEVGTRGG